jgi:tetratricopeptide (TPR) repeat protein
LLASTLLAAHPDLELQIEELTRQISLTPSSADLYLKRGDLYRRHGDWLKSEQDFEKARELEPEQPYIDWYEGRLEVAAGRWAEGDKLISRFLQGNDQHASAYRTRAWARWKLEKSEAAAQDYASAIQHSERPAPDLYRSLVITQYASGGDLRARAAGSADAGLQKFPGEASLMGLAVDLALADADTGRAEGYLATLSPGLMKLPQWKFRQAVLYCLKGDADRAAAGFGSLLPEAGNELSTRPGSWTIDTELIEKLVAGPDPQTCRDAVSTMLESQHP